jgi:glutamate-1-semialdehyde 2,1-aminomutase
VDLFVDHRLELIRRRIFQLPLNLKRNHVSYAHTDAHVDQLIEKTGEAVRASLARRRAEWSLDSAATSRGRAERT